MDMIILNNIRISSPPNTYIVIVIYYFYLVEFFIPSRNLDEVFTYNHIWL